MGAPAARVHELAREWSRAGHSVTVLTGFPNHPDGTIRPEYRRLMWRLTTRENVDGIDVVRTVLYPSANRGTFRRMANYASFCLSAILRGLTLNRPDVVIGSSPQPLVALAGWALARRFRRPFIFEVRDLWPESLPAVGQSGEGSLLFRTVRQVTDFLYGAAALIVPVSAGFVPLIAARFPDGRIALVENGVDTQLFCPSNETDRLKANIHLQDRFVVLYAGTLGMAHGLETVLTAAAALQRSRPDVVFVFIGDGAERKKLERLARERQTTNVIFIGQVPRASLVDYIRASDVCLVLLRQSEVFDTVLPSKMLEFMACAKPMIVGVGGITKALVEKSGAGITITPESADELARAVQHLYRDRQLCGVLGRRGCDYVRRHFTRQQKATTYLEAMTGLASPSGTLPV
jgi:glycosyltransferase involved in cell wall biosynthesis